MDELTAHKTALAEIAWLMDNSDGVKGLMLDGAVMPWAEVRNLYMPSWRAHFEPEKGTEKVRFPNER